MPEYRDPRTWERRAAFEFFSEFDSPFFGVTAELDVTELVAACRAHKVSFGLAVQYVMLRAANECEPFRMRIDGDRIAVYEAVHPSATQLFGDEKLLIVTHDYSRDFREFCDSAAAARQVAEARQSFLDETSKRSDTIHFSMLPWTTFTSISHARNLSGPQGSEPKIPAVVMRLLLVDFGCQCRSSAITHWSTDSTLASTSRSRRRCSTTPRPALGCR